VVAVLVDSGGWHLDWTVQTALAILPVILVLWLVLRFSPDASVQVPLSWLLA